MSGATPDCQELTMQTINANNRSSTESHYVTLTDIRNMNSCYFLNGKNPVTGSACKEAFRTYIGDQEKKSESKKEEEELYESTDSEIGTTNDLSDIGDNGIQNLSPILNMYYMSLGVLGIYILYNIMTRVLTKMRK